VADRRVPLPNAPTMPWRSIRSTTPPSRCTRARSRTWRRHPPRGTACHAGEPCLQHIRAGDVSSLDRVAPHGPDGEASTPSGVEYPPLRASRSFAKYDGLSNRRPAQPVHRTVAGDQRGRSAVADEGVIADGRVASTLMHRDAPHRAKACATPTARENVSAYEMFDVTATTIPRSRDVIKEPTIPPSNSPS
jgi:hypothetical protein